MNPDEILSQGENTPSRGVLLSGGTQAVILAALSLIEYRSAWLDMDDETWDAIENLIAVAVYEVTIDV